MTSDKMSKDIVLSELDIKTKLSEGNWVSWSDEMTDLLQAKRLWGYVSGRITEPDDAKGEDAINEYFDRQEQALGIIKRNCSPAKKMMVRECDTGAQAWELLKRSGTTIVP